MVDEILGEKDAGEMMTLQRAAYVSEAAMYEDFALRPLTETVDEIRAELADPSVVALGVREQGRLIGSVRVRRTGEDEAYVGRLVVAPDRQGEGIGTHLLRVAESVFPAVHKIWLFTGELSEANIRLYTKMGYEETGRTSAGRYDMVYLAKTLPGAVTRRSAG